MHMRRSAGPIFMEEVLGGMLHRWIDSWVSGTSGSELECWLKLEAGNIAPSLRHLGGVKIRFHRSALRVDELTINVSQTTQYQNPSLLPSLFPVLLKMTCVFLTNPKDRGRSTLNGCTQFDVARSDRCHCLIAFSIILGLFEFLNWNY